MPGTVTQTKTHNGVASPDSAAQKGVIHAKAAPAKKGIANGDAGVVKVGNVNKSSVTKPNGSAEVDHPSFITFRNSLPIPLYLGPIRIIAGSWEPHRSPPAYIPPYGVVKIALKDGSYGSEAAITFRIGTDEHDKAVARFAHPTNKDNWVRWDIESSTGRYQWEVSTFPQAGPLLVEMIIKEIAVVRGLSAAALADRSSKLTIRNNLKVPITFGPVVVVHGYWDPAHTVPSKILPKSVIHVTLKDRFGMFGSEGYITLKVNGSEDDVAVARFGCPNLSDNYAEWLVEASTGRCKYAVSPYSYNGPLVVDFIIKPAKLAGKAARGAVANAIADAVEEAEAEIEEIQREAEAEVVELRREAADESVSSDSSSSSSGSRRSSVSVAKDD